MTVRTHQILWWRFLLMAPSATRCGFPSYVLDLPCYRTDFDKFFFSLLQVGILVKICWLSEIRFKLMAMLVLWFCLQRIIFQFAIKQLMKYVRQYFDLILLLLLLILIKQERSELTYKVAGADTRRRIGGKILPQSQNVILAYIYLLGTVYNFWQFLTVNPPQQEMIKARRKINKFCIFCFNVYLFKRLGGRCKQFAR
eukprot:TRINITY_DN6805_c0_g1_i1.p3 TRINITY_DN6805_c0_g1~~TRINITY_DN6805_c0_g1_i1.p3  ORF type:complete len:198 (-),score=-6.89 TRINITY_DN6805_c0_g1_i1:1043-1636(-)